MLKGDDGDLGWATGGDTDFDQGRTGRAHAVEGVVRVALRHPARKKGRGLVALLTSLRVVPLA